MTRPLLAAACLATLAGCSSTLKIQTEYQDKFDFGRYRTYAWIDRLPGDEQAIEIRNPAARAVVVGTLDRELGRRGYKKVALGENPDFLVAAHGWGRDRIDVTQYGYAYGYGGYVYGGMPGAYYAAPVAEVRAYREGTLILDVIDAQSKEMVWRGVATDTVVPGQEPGAIENAVARLLEVFPPKK